MQVMRWFYCGASFQAGRASTAHEAVQISVIATLRFGSPFGCGSQVCLVIIKELALRSFLGWNLFMVLLAGQFNMHVWITKINNFLAEPTRFLLKSA